MRRTVVLDAAIAALAAALGLPAAAASSAVASASDSVSASIGSISRSLHNSSDSSSRRDVAQGDYRIVEVAELADEPAMLQLRLQAVAQDEEELLLRLPRSLVQQQALAAGQLLRATTRPYGVEWAKADTAQAFLLLLDDAWYRDLQTVPVRL